MFRTKEPDSSFTHITPYEWEESVYGKVTELLPQYTPKPKGKHVVTVSYLDPNLHHNAVTGRPVTGVLHFINKLQATGAGRSKLYWRQLHAVLSTLQLEPV